MSCNMRVRKARNIHKVKERECKCYELRIVRLGFASTASQSINLLHSCSRRKTYAGLVPYIPYNTPRSTPYSNVT